LCFDRARVSTFFREWAFTVLMVLLIPLG